MWQLWPSYQIATRGHNARKEEKRGARVRTGAIPRYVQSISQPNSWQLLAENRSEVSIWGREGRKGPREGGTPLGRAPGKGPPPRGRGGRGARPQRGDFFFGLLYFTFTFSFFTFIIFNFVFHDFLIISFFLLTFSCCFMCLLLFFHFFTLPNCLHQISGQVRSQPLAKEDRSDDLQQLTPHEPPRGKTTQTAKTPHQQLH